MRWMTAAIVCTLATPLAAQWLNYPTAGVPKTPDGKPNLTAPAPRTADGKPDFSGTWDVEHNRKCPPEGCADLEAPFEFGNFGYGLKGGLPYQPWAAALVKERTATNRKDDPFSACMPPGAVRLHVVPLLHKVIQVPGLVAMLYELNASYRQIFTDGRPLPEDPQPSWNGYSTGKWDGETLVVQTAGFRDGLWLDTIGSPLTDAAKVIERFRRVNYGTLELDITVDDPKAYTKPWTIHLNQHLALDTDLLDYICVENERDEPHLKAAK
jgi:hypothetical protein